MSARQSINEFIEYQHHPEQDINEYVFHKSGRNVTTAWFEHLDIIVKAAIAAEADEIRFLVDVTQGGNRQQVGHMFGHAKALAKNNPNSPPRRYAVIGSSSSLGGILSPFMKMLRLKFRYFVESQGEAAIQWLVDAE